MVKFVSVLMFALSAICGLAQTIEIKGTVTDIHTNLLIENVNIYAKNAKKGTTTNLEGNFSIILPKGHIDTLIISCIGYITQKVALSGKKKISFYIPLQSTSVETSTITIRPKKEKYSRKNNPAVELQQRVVARKDSNRLQRNDYYQYKQHEILQLAVNNFSDSIKTVFNTMLKWFDFSTQYIDFSELNSNPILPVYITENVYTNYYSKAFSAQKKYLKGNKSIYIHRMVDMDGFEILVKQVFENIDIYDNAIRIFGIDFMSPLSPSAPSFYKFYITDTVLIGVDSCINLQFFPHNTADVGFFGNLYIVKDTACSAVKKVKLQLPPKVNVNWVDDLLIEQEYQYIDGNWCLIYDEALADVSALSKSFISGHVKRSNRYGNYVFHKRQPDSLYRNYNEVEKEAGYKEIHDTIWRDSLRLRELKKIESNTYAMFDELRNSFRFKAMTSGLMILMTGYVPVGCIEIGTISSILSYNDIEGFRFRLGARTNTLFSKQLFLNAYAAYGTYDERFKYMVGINYSFNKKRFFMSEYPTNMLSLSYRHDNSMPGIPFSINNNYDGFFTSFRTSPITKMTADKTFKIGYDKDFSRKFQASFSFFNTSENALGEMNFNTPAEEKTELLTSQFGLKFRIAPSERFYQVNGERKTINNSNPVFTFSYDLGVKDLFNADYTFHFLNIEISKRTFFPSFGYLDLWLSAGKIWNPVPYPLLFIPQGNQSYFSKTDRFNLMNISEFASDQYVSFMASYMSSGFLFNRIPLIRRLHWREALMFKTVWGSLRDNNLPQNNSDVMIFPVSEDGETTLFSLEAMPYIEASVGITNIFNILRLDFFKRFTYLNNPNALSWGIRVGFQFDF